MKKMIVIMAVAVLMLTACSSAILDGARKELEDTIADVSDSENRYVRMVKGGYRVGQPELTYGDAFEYFFASPRWKYFKAEDGQDVVEFTGDCMYRDVSVKARIQFIVDEENGTFEPGYLAFNEVPQDVITRSVLIQTVFEKAEQAGIGNNKVNMNAMSSENSENSGTGYLIYKDISLSELLNKSADEVCNILGFPTSGTPVDGELLYGGTEFYVYNGLVLYFDNLTNTVAWISVQSDLVKINGETLNKDRTGLIDLLGQPTYEDYYYDESGEFSDCYYMQYTLHEKGIILDIEMPDVTGYADSVTIYEYDVDSFDDWNESYDEWNTSNENAANAELRYDDIYVSELLGLSVAEIVSDYFGGGYIADGNGLISYDGISFEMADEETVDSIWIWEYERCSINGETLKVNGDGVIESETVIDLFGQNYEDEWLDIGYFIAYHYPEYTLLFEVNKFNEVCSIIILRNF